jgi:membrane-associated protein
MHIFLDIPTLISTYGYMGIFIIVFLESGIFFALPGDSLLFTAGLLAPKIGMNIIFLIFLIFVAAFLGGLAGYYIGMKIEMLHRYKFFRKILKQEYIDRAHDFLEKHGLGAMLLSRFVPIIRTFLPVVAGIVKMNFSDFIRYSLLGSFVWSFVFTLGGYYLGRFFPKTAEYLWSIVIIFVFISILPIFFEMLKKKENKD